MLKYLLGLALAMLVILPTHADADTALVIPRCGGMNYKQDQILSLTQGTDGSLCVKGTFSITTNPTTTPTFSFPGCTVGTASAACLAGGVYTHVTIQNVSVGATLACRWGGAAGINESHSVTLTTGQSATWGASTGGAPQSTALNCISSAAAQPLYVELN